MDRTQAARVISTFNTDTMGDAADLLDSIRYGTLSAGEPRATGYQSGIKALMLAVLEDGIRCYLGKNRQARDEAECWMATRRQSWPFSFGVICHTLGLHPDAVRAALNRMREHGVSPRQAIGRTRPNVRRKGRIVLRRRRQAAALRA